MKKIWFCRHMWNKRHVHVFFAEPEWSPFCWVGPSGGVDLGKTWMVADGILWSPVCIDGFKEVMGRLPPRYPTLVEWDLQKWKEVCRWKPV